MSGEGMEGQSVLAGEYVLGLLDAEATQAVERLAEADPEMAAAIRYWRARLDPLTDLPAPAAPSPGLWYRIDASLTEAAAEAGLRGPGEAPNNVAQAAREVLRDATAAAAPGTALAPVSPALPAVTPANDNIWRALALASMAAAAGLAVLLWRDRPAPPLPWARAVAMLAAPGAVQAGLRVQVTDGGSITVVPLVKLEVAQGDRLGLWAWPQGQPAPVLLGLIRPEGGQLRYPYQVRDGTPVMVTREPQAGPGATPGPTLYLGQLATTS